MTPETQAVISLASTIVATLSTVVLVVLTNRYVRLTAGMADAIRSASEPSVVATLEFPERILYLKVENFGRGSAFDISFKVVQDVGWIRKVRSESGLASLSVINEGISCLAPGQSLRFLVGILTPTAEDIKNSHYLELKVSFKDQPHGAGKVFENVMTIDFKQLRETQADMFLNPLERIAQVLKAIADDYRSTKPLFPDIDHLVTKTCPVCGERIPLSARKCPRCLEFIETTEPRVAAGQ